MLAALAAFLALGLRPRNTLAALESTVGFCGGRQWHFLLSQVLRSSSAI